MEKPTGRKTTSSGGSANLKKGSGTGHSAMGGGSPFGGGSGSSGGSSRGPQRSGGGGGCGTLIIGLVVVIVVAVMGIGSLFGDSDDNGSSGSEYTEYDSDSDYDSDSSSYSSDGWELGSNSGKLITDVSSEARPKRTKIKGDGSDTMTIMLYLCGTDLESRSKCATTDLQEMLAADLSDNINILVYTGGCKGWQNNVISSKKNQIYKISDNQLECLEKDMGSKPMTDPDNLSTFIRYCEEEYPANRYELIMWDHGGGSLSGYGYDEKSGSDDSMDLSEIKSALEDGGVTFDFVGFDACLMATAETALMLDPFADYLIASEEIEPGVGWFYTKWLNEVSKDPGMDTVSIGKLIVDTYTAACEKDAPGQDTTLSVIDLAEFSQTVPDKLQKFAAKTRDQIDNEEEYKTVTNARGATREFAESCVIDQIDLCHFTNRLGTSEGEELREAILNTVKYNKVSRYMENSYGVSIYFPYRGSEERTEAMSGIYSEIGMGDDYGKCITSYRDYQEGGQYAALSNGADLFSFGAAVLTELCRSMPGQAASSAKLGTMVTSSEISDAIGSLSQSSADYIANNQIDPSHFQWTKDGALPLTDEDWELITEAVVCLMVEDDGEWLVMGEDTPDIAFNYNDDGYLVQSKVKSWLTINNDAVAYYQTSYHEDENGVTAEGRIPCTLNDEYGYLIVSFTPDNQQGSIVGFRREYRAGETDTVSKMDAVPKDGDVIQLLCDGYDSKGNFTDVYKINDPIKVKGKDSLTLVNAELSGVITYKFTDIYGNVYYTRPYEN